jgi:hypothetical protein
MDAHYSTKLPLDAIRKLAGYPSSNKLYFNTRSTIRPPQELLNETPIGRFVYTALDGVLKASEKKGDHQTAVHFLKFLEEINVVFLQDAAAISVLYPGRFEDQKYHLFVFQCFHLPQWQVSFVHNGCRKHQSSTARSFLLLLQQCLDG